MNLMACKMGVTLSANGLLGSYHGLHWTGACVEMGVEGEQIY